MKHVRITVFLFFALFISMKAHSSVDQIKVYKSLHRMDLIRDGHIVKSYRVMLARGGSAPKRKEGDHLVPEGEYILDYKNPDSKFYKSLHISYPNDEDVKRAQEAGVDPGGDIMIHGYPNKESALFKILRKIGLSKLVDWTAGCVAVTNDEMEELYNEVDVYTPITLYH
jgi:murein L,D-transpeptidase YafK